MFTEDGLQYLLVYDHAEDIPAVTAGLARCEAEGGERPGHGTILFTDK